MGALQTIEKPLDQLNSKLPALPKNVKNSIAQFASWAAAAGAVLMGYVAFKRWDDIQNFNDAKEALDTLRESFGALGSYAADAAPSTGSTSLKLWILFILALASTTLFAFAFVKLQKYSKQGWDLAFGGILASLVYVIAFLIISEFELGDVFVHLLVTLAGLYALLQIKDYFTGKEKVVVAPKQPTPPSQTPQA